MAVLSMNSVKKLTLFISSPGDVGPERLLATRVVQRLQGEFAGRLELQSFLWEHEPLRATGHFQEQIVRPSECDVVICILWSRLGTRLPSNFHRADGSTFSSGTEWEFEDAATSYQRQGKPDLLVYRKTSEPLVALTSELALLERLEQKRSLESFIDRWFGNPQQGFKNAFHAFAAADEFESMLESHLRALFAQHVPEHFAETSSTTSLVTWHQGSPFRGLRPFDFEHAAVFFGRTRAIMEVQGILQRQASRGCAFVLVLGMSGGGKSSLVRAGLLPTLTHPGVIEGIDLWRRSVMRPSDSQGDFCAGLAVSLLAAQALPELSGGPGLDAYELAALMREAPQRVISPLRAAMRNASEAYRAKIQIPHLPAARLVLYVDQLEEIFTHPQATSEHRQQFVAALSMLARSGLVWVLATMRSDFYGRCAELPELIAMKEGGGHYDLLAPGFAESGQMIVCPARAAGLRFEVDPTNGTQLDAVLHEAAVDDPRALPLLEFTLEELYKHRTPEGILTFAAYQRLGGLEGAIGKRAEEVYQALPGEVQDCFAPTMRMLVTAQLNKQGVLNSTRAPLAALTTTTDRLRLINALVSARLLVTDTSDDGAPIIRIAHEALMEHWPRLANCLSEDCELLHVRARVAAAEERWHQDGRPNDLFLPTGKALVEAEDLLSRRPEEVEPQLASFITASRQHHRSVRRRRRRLEGIIAASVFTLLSVFGLVSYFNWQSAQRQTRLAEDAQEHDRLTIYAAQMGLAQRDWRGGNIPGALALLNSHLPFDGKPDLRSFEWHYLWQACREKLILMSDSGVIRALAFEPRGRMLATTGFDNSINLWDTSTGERLTSLRAHVAPAFCVAFSPDGTRLVSGGFDERIIIWDTAARKPLQTLSGHTDVVTGVCFSPDGKSLASGSDDDTVRLWDVKSGSNVVLWRHTKNVHAVQFAPQGEWIASTSGDGTLKLGPAKAGAKPLRLRYDFDPQKSTDLYALSFDRGGTTVAAGAIDGGVGIWSVPYGERLSTLIEHPHKVQGITFGPHDTCLATTDESGLVRIWKPATGKGQWQEETHFNAHAGAIFATAFSPDGNLLATGSADSSAKIWDTSDWSLKSRARSLLSHQLVDGFQGRVTAVKFSPRSRHMAAADATGRVALWNLDSMKPQWLENTPLGQEVYALEFSGDGKMLMASAGAWDDKGVERAWLVEEEGTCCPAPISLGHSKTVTALAVSPNGQILASASFDGRIKLFDLTSSPPLREIALAQAKAAGAIGVGGIDVTSARKHRFDAHDKWIYAIAFSPDGKMLASASHDRTVRLWNLKDGSLIGTLEHIAWVYSIAFSPDGALLATANWDGTVRLWSTETHQPVGVPLRGHTEAVKCLSFTPDGKTVASASEDGTVRLWNVALGQEMVALEGSGEPLYSLAFQRSGRILAAGGNRVIHLFQYNESPNVDDAHPR